MMTEWNLYHKHHFAQFPSFNEWLFNKLLECPVESWRESASDKIDS